jgi:hypothetical protein
MRCRDWNPCIALLLSLWIGMYMFIRNHTTYEEYQESMGECDDRFPWKFFTRAQIPGTCSVFANKMVQDVPDDFVSADYSFNLALITLRTLFPSVSDGCVEAVRTSLCREALRECRDGVAIPSPKPPHSTGFCFFFWRICCSIMRRALNTPVSFGDNYRTL